MTRVTAFGMPKREHHTSAYEDSQATKGGADQQIGGSKKRRRDTDGDEEGQGRANSFTPGKGGGGWGNREEIVRKAQKGEQRRLARVEDRQTSHTCFACRSQGHRARDCPNVLLAAKEEGGSLAVLEGEGGVIEDGGKKASKGMKRAKGKSGADVAGSGGRCYRCDSSEHPLSRCPKPTSTGLPFATCFICLQTGHLASTCPRNDKGVYPNGGSCKVCGSKAHRAQDCPDDKRPKRPILSEEEKMVLGEGEGLNRAGEIVLGVGSGVGADEDDFMVAKRKRVVLDKEDEAKRVKEKAVKKAKKEMERRTIGSMAASQGEERPAAGPTLELEAERGQADKRETGGSRIASEPAIPLPHPALAALANRKKAKVVAF